MSSPRRSGMAQDRGDDRRDRADGRQDKVRPRSASPRHDDSESDFEDEPGSRARTHEHDEGDISRSPSPSPSTSRASPLVALYVSPREANMHQGRIADINSESMSPAQLLTEVKRLRKFGGKEYTRRQGLQEELVIEKEQRE
jgi:hypothetical protein